MSDFVIIGTFVTITLVGAVIYLLLGTIRAALASHEGRNDYDLTRQARRDVGAPKRR